VLCGRRGGQGKEVWRFPHRRTLASPLRGPAQDLPAPALQPPSSQRSRPRIEQPSREDRVRPDTATLAAYDQPEWCRGCAAERHRLGGLGCGPRVTTSSASASAALPGEFAVRFRDAALRPGSSRPLRCTRNISPACSASPRPVAGADARYGRESVGSIGRNGLRGRCATDRERSPAIPGRS
jgi:hypothetical protein